MSTAQVQMPTIDMGRLNAFIGQFGVARVKEFPGRNCDFVAVFDCLRDMVTRPEPRLRFGSR